MIMKKNIIKRGDSFARLKAISYSHTISNRGNFWLFECICGTQKIISIADIMRKKKNTKSCGCLSKEILLKIRTKHSMRKTRFYRIWVGMKTRCLNKNHQWFKHYGGKGIKIDEKWLNFQGFMDDMYLSYISHLSKYSENDTTLDRIDGSKNYCLENCRWATRMEQSNNASSIKYITYNNQTMSLSEWSRKLGIAQGVLWSRIYKQKLPIEKSFLKKDFRKKIHGKN